MSKLATEDGPAYRVVVNHEGQYSLWPVDLDMAAGWRAVTEAQSKEAALEHIRNEWTDMRPLSLRGASEQQAP